MNSPNRTNNVIIHEYIICVQSLKSKPKSETLPYHGNSTFHFQIRMALRETRGEFHSRESPYCSLDSLSQWRRKLILIGETKIDTLLYKKGRFVMTYLELS